MLNIWVIGFLVLFFGVAALIVVAGRRQRQAWLGRADALRAIALRRSARVDEQPADPQSLLPMKPFDPSGDLRRIELPVVVRGGSPEVEYRLFDVHTNSRTLRTAKNYTERDDYTTYVTITSARSAWPRFEFIAVSDVSEDSLTGRMLGAAGALAEGVRSDALTRIPIPHRPGFQLYVADAGRGQALSDTLMKIFEHKTGWWVAAIDRAIAFSNGPVGAKGVAALTPVADLDALLDDAIAMERTLRAALAKP